MRRCVSLFHIWRAELGNLTCYVGHHNVLCLPLWQGVFLFTLQRYGLFRGRPNFGYRIDAKFNTNSSIFCVELAPARKSRCKHRFSLAYSQPSARAVGVCEITPLSKRLVEFVESVEFVETQTADFEQVIPLSTNSTNSTSGKKTGAFRYLYYLPINIICKL